MKTPIPWTALASLTALMACQATPPVDVRADEIVRPAPVERAKLPKNIDPKLQLGIAPAGFAFSPDGRVVVQDYTVPHLPAYPFCGFATGWVVRVLRHEGIGHDSPNGTPVFSDNVWSPPIPISLNDLNGTNGITGHVALAITVAPEMQTLPFPYPSDDRGNLDPDGTFETYDLSIVTQPWHVHGIDPSLGCNQNIPSLRIENRLLEKRLKVVVRNARTAQAEVAHAELFPSFTQLGWRPGADAAVQSLIGLEPTMSFDGRVLIWQGHPDNNKPEIDRDHTRHMSGILMYSYNENPLDRDGWSRPRSINEMYYVDRDVLIDGVKFAERYPIAAQPLRAPDGNVLGANDMYLGAYPWVNLDMTELYHTSTQFQTSNLQNGFSVIGRDTGYALRLVDGPLNPDRQVTRKVIFQGTGIAPGMWAPARDMVSPPLPYTRPRHVAPIFGMSANNYGEVSFDEFLDQDYVLVLEMNEMLELRRFGDLVTWRFDTNRTPDTSGRFNIGYLEGANFPIEAGMTDKNHGIVGQALYFDGPAAVRVPDVGGLDETRDAFTAELFVRRPGSSGVAHALIERDGAFGLYTDGAGGVHGAVWASGGRHQTATVHTNIDGGAFTHLALTYDAVTGRLVLYEDGRPRTHSIVGGPIDASGHDIVIGPGPDATAPAMWIDEVKVSRVARTEAELRRAAYVFEPEPASGPAPVLPLGLDSDEFIVPLDNLLTREKIDLGRRLFFDRQLSVDHSTSCATCHDPDLSFTDGEVTAIGLGGKVLGRNTPTSLNRAFSRAQFWDSRAPSVEAQATMPIEHPDEMGLPITDAITRLNRDESYPAEFAAAFGAEISKETIAKALASFERATVTGGSRVDMFEAGNRLALTISEIRGWILFSGKARCIACHDGSNYSDESLHVALNPTSDLGAFAVTGRTQDRERFKTPTLRNIAFTAPYFHDGSAATLEEVVDRYDRGGDRNTGRDPEIFPLGLTDEDKADLVSFMRALISPIVTLSP